MRILFASRAMESPAIEGGFVLLSDLAHAMANEPGFEVGMFSVSKGQKLGVQCIGGFSGTGWDRQKAYQFSRAMLKNQSSFDIVHTAHVPARINSTILRVISSFGRRNGVRYLHTLTATPQAKAADFQKLLWADANIGQTQNILANLSKSNVPSTYIEPWPSPGRIGYKEDRRGTTRKRYFQKFNKVIVFPGEFSRLGIDTSFTDCVQSLLQEVPDSCFVFACRHDTAGIAGKIISDCRVKFPGRVINLGEIDWVISLIEAADLILFPAIKMQCKFQPPLVLMEALGLGRPILVSSNVSMPAGSGVNNMVSRCETHSWEGFGRCAVRILKKNTSGSICLENKFQETVLAYKNIYLGMCGKL